MKKATLILGCLILLFVSSAIAEEENIYSGKVHNQKMTGVERSFKGELICLGCNLKESGARADCKTHGHNIRLKTQNGVFLTILPNQYSDKLLADNSFLHKPIEITGYHFAKANTLDLLSYTIAEKTMSWCVACQKMDDCAQK